MASNKVLVSGGDTTPGYLSPKLISDYGVILSLGNIGGDEVIDIGLVQTPSWPIEDNAGSFSGPTATIYLTNSLFRRLTLTGNVLLGIGDFVPGRVQNAQLKVIQGSGGSKTLTISGAKTPNNGTGLTLSTAAGAEDLVHLYWDGTTLYAWVEALGFA